MDDLVVYRAHRGLAPKIRRIIPAREGREIAAISHLALSEVAGSPQTQRASSPETETRRIWGFPARKMGETPKS